ncbi:uncharacterized protein LOC129915998 [Episyrphus balteatus]|uniref:uncharacterized protein LOC129915998 n=1 Tax=Episyrphus balteatus TaxID=286459 RepID=UPI00248693BF|nr:uncharacterized protein LOC129915998 [Episyrphus balteatus]
MQLTPDYLISECGCPQVPSIPSATEYPANLKENYLPSAKLRFHNYITSSRRRLLPRRESLSDYYDKLLMNSTAQTTTTTTMTTKVIDISKRQLPMQADTLKHMKCAMNEAIRKADNKQYSRSQQSAISVDSNKKQYR